jgi:tRNA A-37 threonylcarbamoyl transferase component Bud32
MTTAAAKRTARTPAGKARFADARAAATLGGAIDVLCDPAAAGWSVVKSNAARTVYRGRIDGLEIYVKHFHSRSPVHRAAERLGLRGATLEMRFARLLSAAGVPTPPVLAAMNRGGHHWLATAAVPDAQAGDQWHLAQLADPAPQARAAVRQATVELAAIIGRMHSAGIVHDDLHCGNVLVSGWGVRRQVVMMDLHRMRRRRRLSRRARARNLAQLLHDRADFTTRTDRLRFLRHYLAASGDDGPIRYWQMLIEHFARPHARRQYANRDRRILAGDGRYFARIALPGGWRGAVVLASKRKCAGSRAADEVFTAAQWSAALADPAALLRADGAEVLADSPSALVVRRRLSVGGRELDVCVKQARRRSAHKRLCDCFRRSRSLRAFELGHMLLARRIDTALPLAALQRRVGPLLADSILITEAIDSPRLDRFLAEHLANPPRADLPLAPAQQHRLAQAVLWQLGRMLQRLHDNDFAHRDLKAGNILVRWSPPGPPRTVLVNLDGLRRTLRISTRQRFAGLMRLNVSLLECPTVNRAGRLRMLLGYLRRGGAAGISFKAHWRALEEWSHRKLTRQIRSRQKRQKALRRPAQ